MKEVNPIPFLPTLDKAGRLYIFLGMCPGVGKTYTMLQAARQRQAEGGQLLVGLVETHGRQETAALLEGLTVLPRLKVEHRGHFLEEMDLDGILNQRPELVLVDELAHTNAPGCRHAKRYQDVLEILDAGIDVYTTLNVQHIESQVDIVRRITEVSISETVPDSILDRAHEIQLIDLSVEKLLERLHEGRVYLGDRAHEAMQGFFKEGNLTALRELALRFTAERVDRDLEDIRRARRVSSPWKTNARLLTAVGPSPYAESLIRWTRRAAARLNCPWLVVWVEGLQELTASEQERLVQSLNLARRLGAEIVTISGESMAESILQVARERNVTQIVVGKTSHHRWWRSSLADRLIQGSGDIDICIVRPLHSNLKERATPSSQEPVSTSMIAEYSWVCVAVFVIVSLGWVLTPYTGYIFVALVFLLAVVVVALRFHRAPVLVMAGLCALCWNYFFIPPQLTFHVSQAQDMIMLGMFFMVALSMGSLTHRLRMREAAERRRASQTDALLRVTQSAALAAEPDKGLMAALRVIQDLLRAPVALIVRNNDRSLPKEVHAASTFQPMAEEWGVAAWVYANKQCGGRSTDTLPESTSTWFPLQTATATMGVLGVRLDKTRKLDFTTRQMIEAFSLQLALVLEKEHFIQAMSQAELLAHSERLHKTLLDSVSHELKTPIAVITASLEGLADNQDPYLTEIATATQRLRRVVDGLLNMNRVESSVLHPQLEWNDLNDVISAACQAVGSGLQAHPLQIHLAPGFPLLRIDHHLLAQTLANILHNAATYTPAGTPIEIFAELQSTRLQGGTAGQPTSVADLNLTIRDHGPGLPPGEEARVFEKFYRAEGSPTGGTGLGLAIARGFVQAMDGQISARNHPQGGAEFRLSFPAVAIFDDAVLPSL